MSQAAAIASVIQTGSAHEIFNRQRAAYLNNPYLSLVERRHALMALETLLVENQEEIAEAICQDFGHRSLHETKLLEIFPTVSGLADARRRLKKWVKPQHRHVSFWFMGPGTASSPSPRGWWGLYLPGIIPCSWLFLP